MENIEKLALEIIERAAQTEGLEEDMDMDLFEVGLLDSLSVISIIISIEEKFGIRLQPTDFVRDDIASVNNFINFLKNHVK